MKETIVVIICVAFLSGCSYICGINEEMQAILSRTAQAAPEGVRVERIPCEVNYLNAICSTPSLDTAGLLNLANYFWDEERRIGWKTLMVYDSQGELVYTVTKKDRIEMRND